VKHGWRTYNFEVNGLHTYIAEGLRSHNDSAPTLIFARAEFETKFGHEYTHSEADQDLLMGGIVDGKIHAYGDYVDLIRPDTTDQNGRFSAAAFDAIKDKIAQSGGALDAVDDIVMQMREDETLYITERGDQVEMTVLRDGGILAEREILEEGGGGRQEFYDEGGRLDVTVDYGADGEVDVVRDNGRSFAGAQIGAAFGSAMGNLIATGNIFADIAASTVLGAIGQHLGDALQNSLDFSALEEIDGISPLEGATKAGFGDFNSTLTSTLYNNVSGTLSSFLVGELAESLGLRGVGAKLFATAAGSVTQQLLTNVGKMALNQPSRSDAAHEGSLSDGGLAAAA
jgi:hypothetical protein